MVKVGEDAADNIEADEMMKLNNLQRLAVMGRWRGGKQQGEWIKGRERIMLKKTTAR